MVFKSDKQRKKVMAILTGSSPRAEVRPIIIGFRKQNILNRKFDRVWADRKRKKITEKQFEKRIIPLRNKSIKNLKEIIKQRHPLKKPVKWEHNVSITLDVERKTRSGKITFISPEDFLRLSSPMTFSSLSTKSLDFLIKRAEKQGKMDTLFMDYDSKKDKITGHEGRHRAIVAKMLGIKKLRVAIIGKNSRKFNVNTTREEQFSERLKLQDTNVPLIE